MRATYLASTLGMRHMSFCQGLRWFSAKRRRTVSRDRLSWSVSLTIAPASNSSVQRARPSGGHMQRHFQVSPPSVHQMVLTLERTGLIRRTAGVARSIELLVAPEDLPVLH